MGRPRQRGCVARLPQRPPHGRFIAVRCCGGRGDPAMMGHGTLGPPPPVIARWLSRTSAPAPVPVLQVPVAVVGDIHGRADLLEAVLTRLAAHPQTPAMRVVVVGDMVDRGPDALAVLTRLHGLCTEPSPFAEVICLMGNHEQMCLNFLADPVTFGPRWLAHGGDKTLESAGVDTNRPARDHTAEERLTALRDRLAQALGPALVTWMQDLPLIWREDRLVVTHAALMPGRTPDNQPPDVLLWGHPAFLRKARRDGLWVAHGHTIVPEPAARDSRISVDTGAWRTGRLTAAVLDQDGLQFVTHTPDEAL